MSEAEAQSSRRLVVTAVILGVALAAVTGWVVAVGGGRLAWDQSLHELALHHRTDGLTAVATAVSRTSEYVAYVLAAIAGVMALRPRPWWAGALAGVLTLAACQGIRVGLAALIGRSRPPEDDWGMYAAGFSFPSGHTATATFAAGLLCIALAARAHRGWLAASIVVGALWAIVDGVGRVYLGVHWPTDVLAGWLLGALLTFVAALLLSAVPVPQDGGDAPADERGTSDPGRPEEPRPVGRR